MQEMCEDKYGCSKAEGKKHREGNLERSGCRSRSSRPPLSWQFWCPGEDVFPLSPPLHMCSWSPFVRIGMNWAYIAFADLGHNCQLNTCTTWDLWVKFYLGQNENCSPRVSTSESSEDCSQEYSVEEGQYTRFWWRGSSVQLSTHFIKGFMLVTRSWCHHEGV